MVSCFFFLSNTQVADRRIRFIFAMRMAPTQSGWVRELPLAYPQMGSGPLFQSPAPRATSYGSCQPERELRNDCQTSEFSIITPLILCHIANAFCSPEKCQATNRVFTCLILRAAVFVA